MKTVQNLIAAALVCSFTLTSPNLFGQSMVPVGPPVPAGNKPSVPQGLVPRLSPQVATNGGVQLGQSYDGIDFLGSNCGCLPPDTNAAVGNNFVVETVNFQIRVFDKTTGVVLLNEPLSTFFGAFSGGDPYVVYDDNANRWYVSAFDSSDSGLFLAVSADGNPLDEFHTFHLTAVGGSPDYEKLGFNKDAIFISFNNFGSGGGAAATIAAIDKAAALSGTLSYFVSTPKFQFRAMPPAQMHGDVHGGVEWFVSTDGNDFIGNTIRVTQMTNYLSSTPTFTYTSLPVTPYQSAARADQPGGSVTTFPNTTTTQVHLHSGRLVTAMASSIATDGFVYPKGLYYQIDVNGPKLIQQGVIDPGPGVAVQMASVAEDRQGNLGFTWMESSNSEYLSMWVGKLANGTFSSQPAAPGGGFFPANSRIGDYSTIAVDWSDGQTFWAANEYIGPDGFSNIWRTHITSFTALFLVNNLVRLDSVSGTFVPPTAGATVNPFAPGGQFDVRAAFTNTGTQSICFVTFQVVTLRSASGALPVLLTSDGALIGGEGAFVPAEVAGASPNLDVGQQQSYGFTIGLPTVETFTFFVNVLGEPHNGSCSAWNR